MAADSPRVAPGQSEAQLVEALAAGDEAAFAELIDRYSGPLRRLALNFVHTPESADDVVQETWLAVLKGIGRFEGRSSFKSWLFAILVNQAKARARRDARVVTFSSLALTELGEHEPSADPDRFRPAGDRWAGHWLSMPTPWDEQPETRLQSAETLAVVARAVEALPAAQRAVITMRDINQLASEEVCQALDLSEGNQRVLLHRARAKVRRALEEYLGGE